MRILRFSFSVAFIAVLISSCNGYDDTVTTTDITPIEFSIHTAPSTRVEAFGTSFRDGDAVGIFATVHGRALAASGNVIDNIKLTAQDMNGDGVIDSNDKWTFEAPVYWLLDGTKLDFYAYYPYDANLTDPTHIAIAVPTDQSDVANLKVANYMSAISKGGNGKGCTRGEKVSLTFRHAMAAVEVTIPNGGSDFGPNDHLKVSLIDIKPNAIMNLSNITATKGTEVTLSSATDNRAINIRMNATPMTDADGTTTAYVYRALVPAQTIAGGNHLFGFINETLTQGKVSAPLEEELMLVAGQKSAYTQEFPNLQESK